MAPHIENPKNIFSRGSSNPKEENNKKMTKAY
jgi:hypothetical protein